VRISVRLTFTKWSKLGRRSGDYRLISQTAYTARPATLWILIKLSTGFLRKAEADRTIGICKCAEKSRFSSGYKLARRFQ
jgi:hypothetical protein